MPSVMNYQLFVRIQSQTQPIAIIRTPYVPRIGDFLTLNAQVSVKILNVTWYYPSVYDVDLLVGLR